MVEPIENKARSVALYDGPMIRKNGERIAASSRGSADVILTYFDERGAGILAHGSSVASAIQNPGMQREPRVPSPVQSNSAL